VGVEKLEYRGLGLECGDSPPLLFLFEPQAEAGETKAVLKTPHYKLKRRRTPQKVTSP
jgi:hypothetical protein